MATLPPSFSASPVPATVRLVNAVFYAHQGVMEEEHKVGGRFEVDVAMDLDIRQAATDDDLVLLLGLNAPTMAGTG